MPDETVRDEAQATPLAFVIPGDLGTIAGSYGYDRRLIAGLPQAGFDVRHVALGADFPLPSGASLAEADRLLSGLDEGSAVLIDGLALAGMPEIVRRHSGHLAIAALIHHPLALETGLDAATAERFAQAEREALRWCRAVIVTSPATGRILVADFGVDPSRLTVALPGTEPGHRAKGGNVPPHLVSVGTLIPRKGHDVLIAALALLADLSWRCSIVGGEEADPVWAARLRRDAEAAGLADRIAFLGTRTDSRDVMGQADIFVLPSRYEGYGMVFAEAMDQGLPIVACAAGAVPEVVPESAGILVPADDAEALAAALGRLIRDSAYRATMADGSFEAGKALPRWPETAAIVASALRRALGLTP